MSDVSSVSRQILNSICIILMNSIFAGLWLFLHLCFGSCFDLTINRLSIDYGPRVVGIAKSNRDGSRSLPIGTLYNPRNDSMLAEKIVGIIDHHGIIEVVIGVPLYSTQYNTASNYSTQLAVRFAKIFASILFPVFPNVSVVMFDESYTTKEARQVIQRKSTKKASIPDRGLFNIILMTSAGEVIIV
jgi:RNase H-fold protein (predicted Holliday junction resolvase)